MHLNQPSFWLVSAWGPDEIFPVSVLVVALFVVLLIMSGVAVAA
jgi:hypothetical protein